MALRESAPLREGAGVVEALPLKEAVTEGERDAPPLPL